MLRARLANAFSFWGLSALALASLIIVGEGCRLPTRTDWNRCTPQETSCLAGFTCDQTTWHCVAATDAGVDIVSEEVAVDHPDTGPVPCSSNASCMEVGKPVCEPASGKCVGCLVSATDCTAPSPACDPASKTCVGCLVGSDCPTESPVCLGESQSCVECNDDHDCRGTKPLCDKAAHRCIACSADSQCTAKDPQHGACAGSGASAGACVGCVDSKTHCPAAASPICDASSSSCRGCRNDGECVTAYGGDPGLCVGGSCVNNDAVIYVHSDSPRCTPSTVGDGSAAAPFCVPADAVAHLTTSRRILVLRGPEPLRSFSLAVTGAPVLVAGQAGAQVSVLSGNDSAYVTVSAGDVRLRDLTIGGSNAGLGVSATGGVLRMNRCQVLDNPDGGISTKNAGFEIVNSLIASNGKSGANAVVLGAVPTGGPTTFAFNTVADNAGIGVFCNQAYPLANVISTGNALAFSKDCVATDACATTCSAAPVLSTMRPYPLTAASSACLDAASGELTVADDLAGQERPQGHAADCGASEFRAPVTPTTPDAAVP